ncbi:MAG: hypothetical protein KGL11_02455 [Alphaproteobacteria bacterium]|nr:hypothetical protein [Alphaproteobacteria bacterium]
MRFHHCVAIRKRLAAVSPLVVTAVLLASSAGAWAGGDSSPGPIVSAQAQAATIGRAFGDTPASSPWHRADIKVYSFCGACTDDSGCGSGNKCCTGDCTNGQMKCYAVATCADAK